jgi:hypothetical protein
MRDFLVTSLLAAVTLMVSTVKLPHAIQPPPSATPASFVPNLSGVWIRESDFAGLVRDFGSKENPPFQPWAQTAYEARLRELAKSESDPDTPTQHCNVPPGVPSVMLWPLPWEIIQAHDRVIIIYEFESLVRQIFTDGRKHPKDLDATYMGHSIGWYEGETLVVDTTGFNDKTWLDPGRRLLHTDALHVTERIHRSDHDTLQVDYTIDDPKAYTKLWTQKKLFKLKPDWQIHEYVCMENNRDE